MLTDPCADPGIFARVAQARLPENSSDNFFCLFCPQLLQFYSGLSMVYFKEKYNFTRFLGGGGPTYFREARGLGVQILILKTHRNFEFPGGCPDPLSPL